MSIKRAKERANPRKYTTILIDRELKKELIEALEYAYPGIPRVYALTLFMPRCPVCHGLLFQKFASTRLICSVCGREFELREIGFGLKPRRVV